MYFDTHAHYDGSEFDTDRDELISSLPASGVELILNPGSDGGTSAGAVALSRRYDHVYAAVGWHPHEAKSFNGGSPDLIKAWAKEPKVVAIGEIGLDYHYDYSPRDVQRSVFTRQMELARELNLPVIIHDREAHGDCMEIIRSFPDLRGVFHCYSGSADMAAEILKMGWYLSFTGAITYKNARKALETIEMMPVERIMIETDAPYLAPVPNRGKRNDSRNLRHIAQVIADIKGLTLSEAASLTTENAKIFFNCRS